jgi:alpha-ketoglutarate-dependent taurine dioxygenase
MTFLNIRPLGVDIPFGVRIDGVTRENVENTQIRQTINTAFEQHGLIVFSNVEPTSAMHVALSNVFGPLKDHPNPAIARVEQGTMPGVIEMRHVPEEGGIVEIEGRRLSMWLPWHFDHCYNNELNRAGLLRALDIPPEGGRTGFVDGIALYRAFPKDLLARIEGAEILYTLNLDFRDMRFGRPPTLIEVRRKPSSAPAMAAAIGQPRAIHPAVWTRASGEEVLHVSPWMSAGIVGRENDEGDALLEDVCQTINSLAKRLSYFHSWQPTDMLIWDNWRVLHSVSGMNPSYQRCMHRTTIKGDYGLGYFEGNRAGSKVLQITV